MDRSTLLPANTVVKHALVRYVMYQNYTVVPPPLPSDMQPAYTPVWLAEVSVYCSFQYRPLPPPPPNPLTSYPSARERQRCNAVHTPHIHMRTSHVSKTTSRSLVWPSITDLCQKRTTKTNKKKVYFPHVAYALSYIGKQKRQNQEDKEKLIGNDNNLTLLVN